ncbi:epidermal growth factor-like protein 6 isoform X3 [Xyrichtys novacula]|uniref:Epidermal growth factor-like protein 6 isoform X3 n=1 Tax=Xyrichtys novacula TaxID=13765 RepID=A0AAV1H137_XYRNO|nr:epidermal growth factor-like protein 6 isoform X3 [Xyrichtys novacula]
MNSYGSYKCYCLNGYTLMPDGSCANSRTCSLAHCQYGCEEVQGEIRCLCPSAGLQLGQDERTCVDIDECVTGENLCPYNRQCVNTFGSYYCKCQEGYDLKYVNGKYDCVAIPDSQVRPKQDNEDIKNVIPEPVATQPPRIRQQPFDYDGEVYIGAPVEERQEGELPEEGEEEEEGEDNQLNPRGDVFISEDFESVFGPATEVKEIELGPIQEEFIMDCNFDQGACEWVQDKNDDMDWSVAYHNEGAGAEYYMTMSGLIGEQDDVARLKLLLSDRTQQGSFCLTFDYRVVGHNVGTLRVLLDNIAYPVWEQSQSSDQGWQTELLTVTWKEVAPESIVFEAQRGKGVGGEIGLDNVVLTSGPCQEDIGPLF